MPSSAEWRQPGIAQRPGKAIGDSELLSPRTQIFGIRHTLDGEHVLDVDTVFGPVRHQLEQYEFAQMPAGGLTATVRGTLGF